MYFYTKIVHSLRLLNIFVAYILLFALFFGLNGNFPEQKFTLFLTLNVL